MSYDPVPVPYPNYYINTTFNNNFLYTNPNYSYNCASNLSLILQKNVIFNLHNIKK